MTLNPRCQPIFDSGPHPKETIAVSNIRALFDVPCCISLVSRRHLVQQGGCSMDMCNELADTWILISILGCL